MVIPQKELSKCIVAPVERHVIRSSHAYPHVRKAESCELLLGVQDLELKLVERILQIVTRNAGETLELGCVEDGLGEHADTVDKSLEVPLFPPHCWLFAPLQKS